MSNDNIIRAFEQTYCFYRQKYVTLANKYTQTVQHPYGERAIRSHLEGKYAIGVFSGDHATRFISVDVDAGGKAAVKKVQDAFVEMGIPKDKIYISLSGYKGYHVDVFFDPWIYNEKAYNLYDLMMWRTGLDPKKVEFRPTKNQAIKLPLGVHAKTGARCWFLDNETLKPIEDIEYIMKIQPISSQRIYDIIKEWNKRHWNELYADAIVNGTGRDQSVNRDICFDSAYYESKKIVKRGTRHATMIAIAKDLRNYGANSIQIRKALTGFYYKQDMEMIESPEDIVLDDIEEIAKWAEGSVRVKKYRASPNSEGKPIRFSREEINNILHAKTSAFRKVALLLYAYCKLFGAAHVSYDTIEKVTGGSEANVKNAIRDLISKNIISRKSGGFHYRNGILLRESNTYFIPQTAAYEAPQDKDMPADGYEYCGKIGAETIDDIYYGMFAETCTIEYLSQFLTGPEIKECRDRKGE